MKKRGVKLLAVALAAVFGVFVVQRTLAATGLIYITPATGSTQKGDTFTVDVRINPGKATDGVEATITYDQSKLQYVSQNSSGSPYTIELGASGGNGTVSISRGILGGTVSANNSLIAKVTFKALVGGTTASLGLSGNSTSTGAYNDPSVSGASRTLTNPPAPTQTPTPTPTPDPTPTSSPSQTPSSTPSQSDGNNDSGESNEDPTIPPADKPVTQPNKPITTSSGVKIELVKLMFKRAEFKVSASKPIKVYIKYGVGKQLNLSTKQTKFATQHTVSFPTKTLVPGTAYSYIVVTEDQNGKVEESDVQVIKTKGYTVRVTILGKNNKPFAHKKVTLHSEPMTAETDADGNVTFEDVAPGQHTIEYVEGDTKVERAIDVQDNVVVTAATETAEVQTFSVVFDEVGAQPLPTGLIAALAGVIGVLIILLVLVRTGKLAAITNRRGPGGGMPGAGTSGIITGGGTGGGIPSGPSAGADANDALRHVEGGRRVEPGGVVNPDKQQ